MTKKSNDGDRATKIWYFSGLCTWPNLKKPDDKYNRYGINLFMDAKSLEKYKESGLTLKEREDKQTGETYITLSRRHSKLVGDEAVVLGPPKVIDADFNELDPNINVGNGSEVTCKVLTYPTSKGIAHQLEVVRVDNLIEYKGIEVDDDVDVAF